MSTSMAWLASACKASLASTESVCAHWTPNSCQVDASATAISRWAMVSACRQRLPISYVLIRQPGTENSVSAFPAYSWSMEAAENAPIMLNMMLHSKSVYANPDSLAIQQTVCRAILFAGPAGRVEPMDAWAASLDTGYRKGRVCAETLKRVNVEWFAAWFYWSSNSLIIRVLFCSIVDMMSLLS